MPLSREPNNGIQVQVWDEKGVGWVGCGRKSIHVDLARSSELLVQRAWQGPGCAQQCPRFLPSLLVLHEPDQLPDLVADDFQGLREVVLQRCVLCEVLRFLLTELLEGKASGNTPIWLPYGSMQFRVGSLLVQLWFRVWC